MGLQHPDPQFKSGWRLQPATAGGESRLGFSEAGYFYASLPVRGDARITSVTANYWF